MSGADRDIEERLVRAIEAYHEAALLYAAVKLGLPETMGGASWMAGDLARALGLSAPHLHRFLRGLCIIGLCEEQADGSFALTPFGKSLTSNSRLAAKVQIVVEQYWQPWAKLAATLQDGKPAFEQVFGMRVSAWRGKHAEQGALFASYLAKETQADSEAILAALDVPETDKVVEIAGTDVTVLAEIPPNADLYLLKNVLQTYDDEDARTVLRNCRAAMPDGARLAVVERLLPERATDDPASVILDLHMMTIAGGRVRTLAEFEALLSVAGLKLSNVIAAGSGLTVMTASR
jgi:O-methyltransferase domain